MNVLRPAEPFPPRRPFHRYVLGDHLTLSPWTTRFRFGYVLVVAGPFFYTAIGIVGPDWDDGKWLGRSSWRRHGPVAICRWRRRGSQRGDRRLRDWLNQHPEEGSMDIEISTSDPDAVDPAEIADAVTKAGYFVMSVVVNEGERTWVNDMKEF